MFTNQLKKAKKDVRKKWMDQITRSVNKVPSADIWVATSELNQRLTVDLHAAQTIQEVDSADKKMYTAFWDLFKRDWV